MRRAILVKEQGEPGDPSRPLVMHSIYGDTARAFIIIGMLLVAPALAAAGSNGVPGGALSRFAMFLLLAGVGYWQLSERPKIYGSTAGIEIEWPWGKRRHFDLADIVEVERAGWGDGSNAFGVVYLMRHRTGRLRFYAREGFAAQVEWLKERAKETAGSS
jgi:hypothetical protein